MVHKTQYALNYGSRWGPGKLHCTWCERRGGHFQIVTVDELTGDEPLCKFCNPNPQLGKEK